MTATDNIYPNPKLDDERLNHAIRDFIKRYEPEERRYRLDFEMDLHRLVRLIYAEASKPYEKALTASLMAAPLSMLKPATAGEAK